MKTFTVNTESLERPFLPEGDYTLEVKGFRPKISKNGDSINLNAQYQVVGNIPPEFASKKIMVFDSLNSKFPQAQLDFLHAVGHAVSKENKEFPGGFEGVTVSPSGEEDYSKATYVGPLLGARFNAHLIISEYNGTPSNVIKYYVCAVRDCAQKFSDVRHSTSLSK